MISSSLIMDRLCGVFVYSTAAWLEYGEAKWEDMMQEVRRKPPHLRIMGLDVEWFRHSPISVFQVATSSHCFVIHLSYLEGRLLPTAVMESLYDPNIIKCGVGIGGDVLRLQREQQIHIQSIMDVAQYSALFGLLSGSKTNLKDVAQKVANLSIIKDKMITRSNWELPLTNDQINYAAEDAFASYLVGEAVMMKVAEMSDVANETFNVGHWLQSTSSLATLSLKRMQRETSRLTNDKQSQANSTTTAKQCLTRAQIGIGAKVRVLDKAGSFLFECSGEKAHFYVMEKSLAVITKCIPGNPRKALEIQLLFDPKVKTRLCTYNALGVCDVGAQCPFAHGVDELQMEVVALLQSKTPSCACCLGTKGLLRHAITPPSFRKYMPAPYRQPRDEDFLPLCGQCNSVIRHLYDEEMKRCYAEAESENGNTFNLTLVSKCSSYASLLLDHEKLSQIPKERVAELRAFVQTNWKCTFFQEFNRDYEIEEPIQLTDAFLERLGCIVPGDVRSKTTMAVLVGNDPENANIFNRRWRDFCFNSCGMTDKVSNLMSHDDWKEFRSSNSM